MRSHYTLAYNLVFQRNDRLWKLIYISVVEIIHVPNYLFQLWLKLKSWQLF